MIKAIEKVMLVMACCLAFACGNDDDPTAGGNLAAAFRDEMVSSAETLNVLSISGNPDFVFTATITEGDSWCSFSRSDRVLEKTAQVSDGDIFVYFGKNTSPEPRHATITLTLCCGNSLQVSFSQMAYSSSATYDRAWGEQPFFRENNDYVYKTYFTTLSNRQKVRNYTICYDVDKRVAHWVAYPLHRCYREPNVGRTDAWSYDPNQQKPFISEKVQQYVLEGYRTGYDRGHQCPSADRYSTKETNRQTFYATNMMPQDKYVNRGVWGDLENKCRENICSDTLYIVTGTCFKDGRMTHDRKGGRMALPSHCWKVLLRTKNGNLRKPVSECRPEELIGIGFLFENRSSTNGRLVTYSKSIAEIEQFTGFEFFRNLKPEVARSVKTQNDPSAWNIR